MQRHTFSLVPFDATGPAVRLDGQLRLEPPAAGGGPALELDLRLSEREGKGGLAQLALSRPAGSAAAMGSDQHRRDGLWEHTCLECFLGPTGQPSYLEFNLAPDGTWNVYALDDYRQGLRASPDYTSLPFQCGIAPEAITLSLRCSLPRGWRSVQAFDWQVSAVLEDLDGALSYWALRHPAGAADFHDRRRWTLAQPL